MIASRGAAAPSAHREPHGRPAWATRAGPEWRPIRAKLALLSVVAWTYGALPTWAQSDTQTFDDWALRCPEAAPCVLEQRIFLAGDDSAPLLQLAFQRAGDGSRILAVIRVPLGVLLSAGITIEAGPSETERVGFHHCLREGCIALLELSPSLRRALERGSTATASMTTVDGTALELPISLMGITAGLRALGGR